MVRISFIKWNAPHFMRETRLHSLEGWGTIRSPYPQLFYSVCEVLRNQFGTIVTGMSAIWQCIDHRLAGIGECQSCHSLPAGRVV